MDCPASRGCRALGNGTFLLGPGLPALSVFADGSFDLAFDNGTAATDFGNGTVRVVHGPLGVVIIQRETLRVESIPR